MPDLLVVDDDPDLGDLLCDLLAGEGYTVRLARDGQEGLACVAERHPDVVLLDVEMPRLTGPEMAYRMLLHDLGAEEIPIVLVSGVTNLSRVAGTVGTPYFLSKPYDFAAVTRLIAKALRERRAPSPQMPSAAPG